MRLTVLTVLAALAIATTAAGTAEAVVCKTAGVPKGFTAAAPAGNAAGAAAARPGRGVGGAGAPGGGAGANRGGVGR